jgi:hypothetical protein
MILWIALIIISIIILLILWWHNFYSNREPPTIHARCNENTSCGGDLTCDINCRRCKKRQGGDCAGDVDCETGLVCHQWKCMPPQDLQSHHVPETNPHEKQPTFTQSTNYDIERTYIPETRQKKHHRVHWNESKNQIFYI